MTVSYSGLWKMLQENGLRKQNDKIIDRICEYLKCQPRDIIEIE